MKDLFNKLEQLEKQINLMILENKKLKLENEKLLEKLNKHKKK